MLQYQLFTSKLKREETRRARQPSFLGEAPKDATSNTYGITDVDDDSTVVATAVKSSGLSYEIKVAPFQKSMTLAREPASMSGHSSEPDLSMYENYLINSSGFMAKLSEALNSAQQKQGFLQSPTFSKQESMSKTSFKGDDEKLEAEVKEHNDAIAKIKEDVQSIQTKISELSNTLT